MEHMDEKEFRDFLREWLTRRVVYGCNDWTAGEVIRLVRMHDGDAEERIQTLAGRVAELEGQLSAAKMLGREGV